MDYVRLDLNKVTPDLPTENEIRFQVALLAAVPALIASFIARFVFDAPLLPELFAQFIFAIAPIWMVELAVGMLGPFAKHLAFLGCTVIYFIALIGAAIANLRYAPGSDSTLSRYVWLVSFSFLMWVFTVVLLIPLLGGGMFGSRLRQGALFTSAVLLVVYALYGMKNVKWITRMEAVEFDFRGYWQRRGWDDRAEYRTISRIDAPDHAVKGEATIAGIAFAGDRGVSKVEVSTDSGKTWEQASIKPALSAFSWVLWEKSWAPGQPGKHRVVVRATDGRSTTQTAQQAPPVPSGSSGYHSVVVDS